MCLAYHSRYLCKCEGKPHLEPCGEISGPSNTFCSTESFPSNRAFCCSIKCCNKATSFAQTRFNEALADLEAWSPSTYQWMFQGKRTRDTEEQLEKRLRMARELLDAEEQVHWWCQQRRLAIRAQGQELQTMSPHRERKKSDSLPAVEEEGEEGGEDSEAKVAADHTASRL